jgi:hypothetical protein
MSYLCDKCEIYPAKFSVKGLTRLAFYDGLCGECCRKYLESIGDLVGANKFKNIREKERESEGVKE